MTSDDEPRCATCGAQVTFCGYGAPVEDPETGYRGDYGPRYKCPNCGVVQEVDMKSEDPDREVAHFCARYSINRDALRNECQRAICARKEFDAAVEKIGAILGDDPGIADILESNDLASEAMTQMLDMEAALNYLANEERAWPDDEDRDREFGL